jgi:hypothetical protein
MIRHPKLRLLFPAARAAGAHLGRRFWLQLATGLLVLELVFRALGAP